MTTGIAITQNGHSRLSPSNHRWPHCPGSVREEARFPDISGEAAIDGTGSHLLLELCLQNNVEPTQYLGQIIGVNDPDQPNGWMIHEDRCERVQMALNYVKRRYNELKAEGFDIVTIDTESKSNPGAGCGRDDWNGTVDITITGTKAGHMFIEICDYKDGRGWVSEKWNSQLIAYLYGKMVAARIPEFTERNNVKFDFRMSIVQPKTSRPIRYQCSTIADHNINLSLLMTHVNQLTTAAARTDDPNAPLIPGDHCLWCKANPKRGGDCTADANQSIEVIQSMSTDIIATDLHTSLFEQVRTAVADPKSMTAEQLADFADTEDSFMSVFKAVKDEIESRIEAGERVPGYAKIPGKMSRVYSKSEEEIEKALKGRRVKKADYMPAKLITPAALMNSNLLTDDQKEKFEKEFITEKAGNMTLKKVSRDHQPETEITEKVESMFGHITPEPAATIEQITEAEIAAGNLDQPEPAAPAAEISFF